MIEPARIHYLSDDTGTTGDYQGDCVVYWMQRSQRATENHALEYAIQEANQRKLPIVVLFTLIPDYPEASPRTFRFMLEGLAWTEHALIERGIAFEFLFGDPTGSIVKRAEDAALLVCDRGFLRHERAWRREIADKMDCPCLEVESDTIVPIRSASLKEEWSAATLRRKITPQIGQFLQPTEETSVLRQSQETGMRLSPSRIDDLLKRIQKYSPAEPQVARGGIGEAERRLTHFLGTNPSLYDTKRNDPGQNVTSGLSPYLHFGQISPAHVARRAAGRGGFLEELIIRRELAINFVWYNEAYDQFACLPDWAEKTLFEHEGDRREYLYSYEELERAETHDPFWNAAQKEMVLCGRMHNYMRMYWGKKILEWSETPEIAYSHAVRFNDRYELDGRDPNGYAGVAWCFGKHDRAWKERPIFGKVRYMNAQGLLRKGDMKGYLERIEAIEAAL